MTTGSIRMQIDSLFKELNRLKVEDNRLLPILIGQIKEVNQAVKRWGEDLYSEGFAENTLKYVNQLVALVELLEIYDCESVGGFGKGQPDNSDLRERMDWLIKKYESKS